MPNLIDQTLTLLQNASIIAGRGVGSGVRGYPGFFPREPDKVVCVTASGGLPPNPRWRLDYPSLQIMVRSAKMDYSDGYDLAVSIKKAMLGREPGVVVSGSDRWNSVTMPGDIVPLGEDELHRFRFSLNFRLIVEPVATDNRTPL